MTDPKYMRSGLDFARGKAIEELGELQAALGKSLRWGWESYNPELPLEQQETNAGWVYREIQDVRGAIDNLEHEMNERMFERKRVVGPMPIGTER
jgi:hypothetical protein